MKPALSTSEAARWLGISKSTLIRAVNRGDIQPAFRTPGRHLRFTPEALTEIRRQLEGPIREAVALISESYAREHIIVPLRVDKDELELATVDPGDLALFAELKVLTRKRIKPVLGVRSQIEQAITQAYKLRTGVDRNVRSFEETRRPTMATRRLAEVKQDAPVVQIVDLIIAQGAEERASDIHIEPQQDHLRVRFRIDGVLHDATRLPATLAAPISSRVKLLANLDIVDRRHSQDGQIQTTVDGRPLDIRVGTIETIWR